MRSSIDIYLFLHFFIFSTFFTLGGIAQSETPDTTEARNYLQKAQELNDGGLYDSAIIYFKKAGNSFRKNQFPLRTLSAYNNVGVLELSLNRLETGRRYLDSIISVASQHSPDYINEEALAYLYMGIYYTRQEDFDSTLYTYKKALSLQKQSPNPSWFDRVMAYGNIGSTLNERGYFEEAIEYLDSALILCEMMVGKEEPIMGIIYNNLGFSYYAMGDNGKAEQYYRKASQIEETCLGKDHPQIAVTYLNLARCLQGRGELEQAGPYFLNSLATMKKFWPPNHPKIASTLTNIGYYYRLLGDLEKSENYLRQSIAMKKITYPETHASIGISMGHLAFTLAEKGKVDSAIYLLQKNITVYENAYGDRHPNVARLYRELGRLFLQNGQNEKAFGSFVNNIEVITGQKMTDRYQLPNLDSVLLHPEIVFGLYDLGRVYKAEFEQTGNLDELRAALQAFDWSQRLNDRIRRNYRSFATLELLSTQTDVIYHEGVETALLLYEETGETAYLNQAFFFSEKMKSLILLEGVKDSEAKVFARVSPEMLKQEAKLKGELAFFEKKYYQEKLQNDREKNIIAQGYRDSIFYISGRLEQLLEQMEKDNPEYYRLKYMIDPPSIEALQHNWLSADQGILSFLVTRETIYAFLIGKEDVKVEKIEKNFPLHTWVEELREGIYGYFAFGGETAENFKEKSSQYSNRAFQLYSKLIKPLEASLPSRIVIIPDSILGLVPFEALLTSQPEMEGAFHQYPYLLREHYISYGLNATLLVDEIAISKKTEQSEYFLAFAPEFKADSLVLAENDSLRYFHISPLNYNQEEATRIKEIMGEGKLFMGDKANLDNFRQFAPRCKLLHIATHAQVNSNQPDYSFLVFSGKNSQQSLDLLYLRDLYALGIQAEMVVLSACETGAGEVLAGEGVVSLARGFFFSGAKSLITSLWSVNDAVTADVMTRFYEKLKAEKTKDLAMGETKLDYIETNDDYLAHPFFWAPFIVMGDPGPIQSDFHWLDYLLLFLLAIVIFWLFIRMTTTLVSPSLRKK